jgi:hypothetical protein
VLSASPLPELLAQIVLPHDPPQAGVDLAVDLHADLAFPTNSFLGAGAFGQVRPWPCLIGCLSCLGAGNVSRLLPVCLHLLHLVVHQ